MTPDQLAKSGSEHGHQRAFFQWLLTWNREVHSMTFAIPNGGARGNDERTRMIRGNALKAEGVKSGVPDIMIAWAIGNLRSPAFYNRPSYHGAFIEMKKMKGGVVGKKQSEWRVQLEARGYFVATCYNWQEAANATAYYFGQPSPFPDASRGQ